MHIWKILRSIVNITKIKHIQPTEFHFLTRSRCGGMLYLSRDAKSRGRSHIIDQMVNIEHAVLL
jgi:hypothetical protein